jgi:hypothetical protein
LRGQKFTKRSFLPPEEFVKLGSFCNLSCFSVAIVPLS